MELEGSRADHTGKASSSLSCAVEALLGDTLCGLLTTSAVGSNWEEYDDTVGQEDGGLRRPAYNRQIVHLDVPGVRLLVQTLEKGGFYSSAKALHAASRVSQSTLTAPVVLDAQESVMAAKLYHLSRAVTALHLSW